MVVKEIRAVRYYVKLITMSSWLVSQAGESGVPVPEIPASGLVFLIILITLNQN